MSRTFFFAALVAACGLCLVNAQVVIEPSDRIVSLTGTIKEIHDYGSPGYGENKKTDPPVTYLAIELPKPINIACTPERPEWRSTDCVATKRLKLFFAASDGLPSQLELKAKKMKGQRSSVAGRLQRQTTAGEYTPIIFEVVAINVAPK